MPGKGYRVLSVKEEVVKKIQDRAKKEEVSISKLLDNLLSKSSINTVKTSSNNTVTDKECNCVTKEDVKNDILSVIETEIQKGFKNARSGF